MKRARIRLTLFLAWSLIGLSTEAQMNSRQSETFSAQQGGLSFVLCSPAGTDIEIFDESLEKTLFTAHRGESLQYVQSFGNDLQEKVIAGSAHTFARVQFPHHDSSTLRGWVDEDFIRLKSQCENVPEKTVLGLLKEIWKFPTLKRPTDSYKTGMRRFGAFRDGGDRLHAAADIYRTDGEPVVAVTSGTVIRDRYYFYLGTYALEIKHAGGKIVRYGEIKGKIAPGVQLGSTVQPGQTIGYVGTVNSGCCSPMLHFEMYAGTATGPLTQSGNNYQRRKDLMDPTANLVNWEKSQFGISY